MEKDTLETNPQTVDIETDLLLDRLADAIFDMWTKEISALPQK